MGERGALCLRATPLPAAAPIMLRRGSVIAQTHPLCGAPIYTRYGWREGSAVLTRRRCCYAHPLRPAAGTHVEPQEARPPRSNNLFHLFTCTGRLQNDHINSATIGMRLMPIRSAVACGNNAPENPDYPETFLSAGSLDEPRPQFPSPLASPQATSGQGQLGYRPPSRCPIPQP